MTYVLATQQPWGVKVFDILRSRGGDWWITRTVAGLRASINPKVRYVFCVNFSSIVPPDVLAMAEIVNLHCTALPFGRGGAPIENLLLRGFTETVLTAHRMVEEIDAGPIYGVSKPVWIGDVEEPASEQMVERRILRSQTKAEILDRFVQPSVELIQWMVETEPEPYPQVGPVVNFKRLPMAKYETFWKARA